jgi:cell division protein FtsQ
VMGGAAVALRRLAGRRPLTLPSLGPRRRRALLVLGLLALLLAVGYRFWLRDSTLVAVEQVSVSGLTTDESARLRAALESTARTMTTLHVERGRLERVVDPFPVVRGLEVETDFPHGLRIRVLEHHAAAIAVTDGGRVPVSSGGTVLRGLRLGRRLPTIHADAGLRGDRLGDAAARRAALVAGGAPGALQGRMVEVTRRGRDGLVVELREGPELIFGDAGRVRAKWVAAARVLADPKAEGASYIDVRLPGRPAAGGLAAETLVPVAPPGTEATTLNP